MAMPPKKCLPLSPDKSGPDADADADADANFARAFQELAKGERTASAMESQLTALERKIDDLLAAVDSPEAPDLSANKASTETLGNVSSTTNAQSEEK